MGQSQLRNFISEVVLGLMFMLAKASAFSSSDFKFVGSPMTYDQAMETCKGLGFTGLAVLNTEEKEAYGRSLVYETDEEYRGDLWVGLQYSPSVDQFVWNNGDPLGDYAIWYDGEPNEKEISTCGRIKIGPGGKGFASSRCDWIPNALCGNYGDSTATTEPAPQNIDADPSTTSTPILRKFLPDAIIATVSFVQDMAPKDSSPSIIWDGTARSLLECSVISSKNANSKFTSYDFKTKNCKLLDASFDLNTDVVEKAGVVVGESV